MFIVLWDCLLCVCSPWVNLVPLFVFLEIREEERKILERAGYFQSITVGVAPIVVVIASVVTFSVHMILGYDLTAAQVSWWKYSLSFCFCSCSAELFLVWSGCILAHRTEYLMAVTAAGIVLYFAQKALGAFLSWPCSEQVLGWM